ncbi:MAG: tRNA (guanine(10)-N(2))-dimethyltransferase [Nanoarchaeota archaeon]|nr:tRNA (guanine(10)-N(2))-dimethyltransferase [Nanoarchaeota archaeon]
MREVKEGKVRILAYTKEVPSKDMPVFYNPKKELDRTLCVLFLKSLNGHERFVVCDLLAASGVRGMRIKKEVGVKKVVLNDLNPNAVKLMERNAKLNGMEVEIRNEEANKFLFNYEGRFDYIDIDPFGSPVPFLEAAIRKLRNKGFLGLTATDTAPLSGTYPNTCLRRYGSMCLRTDFKHEVGLRILMKKVIEKGAEQDVALVPLFAYYSGDYYRAYFQKVSGAGRADELLEKVRSLFYDGETLERGFWEGEGRILGPLWCGNLTSEVVRKMYERSKMGLLRTFLEEDEVGVPWHYDLHTTCKLLKRSVPKLGKVLKKLREKGFKASRTHFNPMGIKTDANIEEVKKVISP